VGFGVAVSVQGAVVLRKVGCDTVREWVAVALSMEEKDVLDIVALMVLVQLSNCGNIVLEEMVVTETAPVNESVQLLEVNLVGRAWLEVVPLLVSVQLSKDGDGGMVGAGLTVPVPVTYQPPVALLPDQ